MRKRSLVTEATRKSMTQWDSVVWAAQVGNLELSQAGVASPLSLLANYTAGLTRVRIVRCVLGVLPWR